VNLKTDNDLTPTETTSGKTPFVCLPVMYSTVVPSHAANKRDIRFGNTLNIVSNLCMSCLVYSRHWIV